MMTKNLLERAAVASHACALAEKIGALGLCATAASWPPRVWTTYQSRCKPP